jgi:nucleotide-binding universal stress UspA family protein
LAPSEYPVITQDQRAFRQRDVWERLHAILGDVPVKVHVREVASQPAVEFLRAADERQSGLLVVGAHQRHGWQRLKAPSFSRNVVAHASTNVLCVPTAAGLSETRIPSIHRVLVATNFTKVCTDALRHAHSLLPAGGALHLVHVCPEPTSGINPVIASELYFDHSIATGKAKEEAEKKLNELPAHLRQVAGVTVTSEVLVYHDISAAICEAADRFGADVICMGTTGHSRAGAALLGSTVEAVLARTHKPVFIATTPLD